MRTDCFPDTGSGVLTDHVTCSVLYLQSASVSRAPFIFELKANIDEPNPPSVRSQARRYHALAVLDKQLVPPS